MSTKTLRKRIALVAVSALGFGLLTSVSANAADLLSGDISIANSGYCTDQGDETAAATARYVAVGSRTVFITASGTGPSVTNADATATITGNARWVSASDTDNVVDSTQKVLTITDDGNASMEITGTGPIQVLREKLSDGADIKTYYFISNASCASGYDAGSSYANLNVTSTDTPATTNVDVLAATAISYTAAGQYSYLRYDANDAYGADIATASSAAIATTTGGCKVSFTATDTTGGTTATATGTGADNNNLVIIGDNTPRVCTVTVTLDGVVVATKTVKFLGEVATLEVVGANTSKYWYYGNDGTSGTTANYDAIRYIAKDSAGNVINPSAAPTYVGLTNGFTQVTVGDGTYGYASSTTNGYATLDVNASSVSVRGSGTWQLKLTRSSDGVAVKSAVITSEINKTPHTFTVAFDKASYQVGDIITLSIIAKDSAGNTVADGSTVGAGISVSVGGTTTLSTIATTNAFTDGVVKYKFAAGTTAASYGYSVAMTTGSDQAAQTGSITITNPAGGVSNAEVLSAIVKLIASINKQITALQKLLLKK